MVRPEPTGTPRTEALARTYGGPEGASRGRSLLAREIIATALEAGLYAHPAPDLLALLMDVDMDSRIPPALYSAVAEVLTWLYRVDQGLEGHPDAIKRGG